MLIVPITSFDLSVHPEKWETFFNRTWPFYKAWFLKEGPTARPGYLTSLGAFEKHFPELVDTYKSLCEQIGGGDLASRYLSMYSPPPYMSGCSQLAWVKDVPLLIRNYDYSPRYFEGAFVKTNWLKPVMGMTDCNWGLLDGVNEDGLCASLTFGGRRITGIGFGIPLIVRYCLETCSTTAEAIEKLMEIPAHMAYNITLLDANLNYATIFFVPGGPNQLTRMAVGTNHQNEVNWSDYAIMTQTVERRALLDAALLNPAETADSIIHKFLQPPLFNTAYEKAFGTLYTAIYSPVTKGVTLMWQSKKIHQTLGDFKEHKHKIKLRANANRLLAT
ncbi:C45 family autoproteolytic acyltransferase/hydrolase [Salibacteraceae bacterium]|nr:C45 family autoproteolytic acyltransferase/hydrolase [Salibacteraceae bacterium]